MTETLVKEQLQIVPNEGYVTSPVTQGFEWPRILSDVRAEHNIPHGQEIYLVVFRSVRRQDADDELLYQLDDAALQEAKNSAGFLRYFAGEMDDGRNCLSFCLWMSVEDGQTASNGPAHTAAREMAPYFYEEGSMRLERYMISQPADDNYTIMPLIPRVPMNGRQQQAAA